MGPRIVAHLEGSGPAKQRLEVVLAVVSGRLSVADACAQLGIGPTRLHELRNELLQSALDSAEPQARGRPAQAVSTEELRIRELEEQVQALKRDLRAAQIRQELDVILPRVVQPGPQAQAGKKKARRGRRHRG